MATGVEVLTLRGHDLGVTSAAFSPDGTRIVTAGADGKLKVWDARGNAGLEVLTLRDTSQTGRGSLYLASFSPDGARVVTGGDGGSGTIWDARTGAEILATERHTGTRSSSFSPDGTRIVTASGTVPRRSGTRQRAPSSAPSGAYRQNQDGGVQPGRHPDCHRERRPYREGLGRSDGRRTPAPCEVIPTES